MYVYSDPSRENDPHALPNVEVFDAAVFVCGYCGTRLFPEECDCAGKEPAEGRGFKYWYAYGFPGCLWDSEPVGPFDSEESAIADMLENAEGDGYDYDE
jgi:hypothetical protein